MNKSDEDTQYLEEWYVQIHLLRFKFSAYWASTSSRSARPLFDLSKAWSSTLNLSFAMMELTIDIWRPRIYISCIYLINIIHSNTVQMAILLSSFSLACDAGVSRCHSTASELDTSPLSLLRNLGGPWRSSQPMSAFPPCNSLVVANLVLLDKMRNSRPFETKGKCERAMKRGWMSNRHE